MTQEEVRKLDKRIRSIQDPFGTGFISFYKIFKEYALLKETTMISVLQEYLDWKLYHLF